MTLTMQPPEEHSKGTMSIGAVSKATGIPTETLRTWERRYGFPRPDRTGGGHRKYRSSVVSHLKLIHEAIERGHRPLNVVGESVDTLKSLLDLMDSQAEPVPEAVTRAQPSPYLPAHVAETIVSEWMEATIRLDHETLSQGMTSCWYRLGPLVCFSQLISPFLQEIGTAWFEGRLTVLHEQFASNQLRKFLSNQWRPLSERASGLEVICTTLPGEYHSLGLHMISVLMSMAGLRVVFLGIDTPLKAISNAVEQYDVRHVLISVSLAAHVPTSRHQLSKLRAALPEDVALVVGGSGAPDDVDGVTQFSSLEALSEWASRLMTAPN